MANGSPENGVFTYDPVGECIYCHSKPADGEPRLEDEHIFAYALGGELILPRASCRRCAGIINQEIENVVCHGPTSMLGRLHAQFDVQSRSRTGDELYPLSVAVDGVEQVLELRIVDYPAVPVVFPAFGLPGIMRGVAPPVDEFFESRHVNIVPALADQEDRLARIKDSFGGKPIAMTVRYQTPVGPFTRMLAKIAHSHAVATYGLDGFRPFLLDVILGRSPYIAHFVGCIEGAAMRSVKVTHQISYALLSLSAKAAGSGTEIKIASFLGALVRLYKDMETPTYLVVVGKPSERTEQALLSSPLPLVPLEHTFAVQDTPA